VKIPTVIEPNNFYLAGGAPPALWRFSLTPQASSQDTLCGSGFVLSISIDGQAAGSLSNGCGHGLTQEQVSALSAGTHKFIINFAGDSTYQSSEFRGTVTG
jgi:hypothetical protein